MLRSSVRCRLAVVAAVAAVSLGGCSVLVSSDGYVGAPDASVAADARSPSDSAPPPDDSMPPGDGGGTVVPEATVDAGAPCTVKPFSDAFERDTPGGQGWTFVSSPASSTKVEMSTMFATSPTRSLAIRTTPIDGGIAYSAALERTLTGPCLDMSFSIRAPIAGTDLMIFQLQTLGGTDYPLLEGYVGDAELLIRETTQTTNLLAALPLTVGAFTKIRIRWTGEPSLLVEVDGSPISLRAEPTYPFGEVNTFELGVPRRKNATTGTVYVDDISFR